MPCLNEGLTVGSINESVGYGYTNGDLTAITTPSGHDSDATIDSAGT